MRLRSATFLPLAIPFVEQFAHATKTRRASDAILLKVTTSDGATGWGETLVRPYLSGETVEGFADAVQELGPRLGTVEWRLDLDAPHSLAKLAPVTAALDDLLATLARPSSVRAWNGLRCALELAIVDALLRAQARGLADLLPPIRKEIVYSGVISAEDPEKSLKIARQLRQLGIQHYKLKVTPATAVELVRDVRALIGAASLRLDANASFALDDALAFCRAIEDLDVAAIEEPLLHATPATLAELQRATKIPIMCDEALVTMADARNLIRHQAAGMFNVRLAKCGGLAGCIAIASAARDAGVALQLGALVGETAILSAVGRALAAADDSYLFVEGSYGTLLLKEDVARQSVRFGHGGRAPLLRGPGFGVDVDESVVRKYAEESLVRDFAFPS
jgi:L-alanine-DL-glutamate epimerase-like enolase superfamily enzyme